MVNGLFFNLAVVVVDSAPNIAERNPPFLPEEPVIILAPRERTEENENFQRQRSSAFSAPLDSTEMKQNFKNQQSSTDEVFSRY